MTQTQSESFFQTGIRVLDALTASGKQIVFMKDIPDLNFNILSCFDMTPFKDHVIRHNCYMNYSDYLERNKSFDSMLLKLTSRYPSLKVYSPTDLFCYTTTDVCVAKENTEPLYFNSDHLTRKGSDLVIADLLRQYVID